MWNEFIFTHLIISAQLNLIIIVPTISALHKSYFDILFYPGQFIT